MVAIISIIISKSTCMIARIYQPIDSAHTLNISYNINPVRGSVSNLFHVMAFLPFVLQPINELQYCPKGSQERAVCCQKCSALLVLPPASTIEWLGSSKYMEMFSQLFSTFPPTHVFYYLRNSRVSSHQPLHFCPILFIYNRLINCSKCGYCIL